MLFAAPFIGGRGGNRTLTPLLEYDFESYASASSATRPQFISAHTTINTLKLTTMRFNK